MSVVSLPRALAGSLTRYESASAAISASLVAMGPVQEVGVVHDDETIFFGGRSAVLGLPLRKQSKVSTRNHACMLSIDVY